ncbi:MAG: hypothetical protein Q9168_006709, partial [Polycauliona sp. 1 TL-2023]
MAKKKKGGIQAPVPLANLDKSVDPWPLRPDDVVKQGPTQQEPSAARSRSFPDSNHERGYHLPDQYQNLDELEEPSPVESSDVSRPQGYLEDHHSNTPSADSRRQRQVDSATSTLARGNGVSRFATELYTISYLIFFSILGTLARLGLQALTVYPGAPVATGVLWANVAGSLIMGFLSEDRKLFRGHDDTRISVTSPVPPSQPQPNREEALSSSLEASKQSHASVKKTIPLYIGLSTGFCGCLTSFSSFIRDAFLALANALPIPISHTSSTTIDPTSNIVHRNGGYSFMAILAVIITTVALCISALVVGAQLATALERYTPSINYYFARKFMDRATVFLAWGSWLGAIFLAIWPPDRLNGPAAPHDTRKSEHWRGAAIFAIVFAPLGCLLRFYVSIMLNSRIKSFPLGTFAVNMFGTALEGMFWDLQHSSSASSVARGGVVGCQ